MEKVKCQFCEKRYVNQQEWKQGFEKTHCATCIAFIKYLIDLEKALKDEMRVLGIQKNLWIKIKKSPEEALLDAIGEGDGLKSLTS